MGHICKSSMKFFSDQEIRYAGILLPHEVQARIQAAVLNFLKVLTSPNPAISNIPLCGRLWKCVLRFWFKRNKLLRGNSFTSCSEPNQEDVDCSACGSSGYAISGDLKLLESLIMKTDARYIIVVEKHAIFQRLAEDHVFNQIPNILLTAKGYPDIATRFLLHRMSRAFPDLPILALVDSYDHITKDFFCCVFCPLSLVAVADVLNVMT
ncbi:Meiotic recombination protein SPO11-2 [Hibiscus syriacus]|uniref:Meiotic recombination protein SPO11-2 n=1 Tax=Hibiscus syriacus TaxID=106335 RepID=A0A6A3CFJ9_HIBSY|nr:Meiotic recombination protein SPO11-2 [Hibiscus syriacus]